MVKVSNTQKESLASYQHKSYLLINFQHQGFTEKQYIRRNCLKRELGQCADLREGLRKKEEVVFLKGGGGGVDTPMCT